MIRQNKIKKKYKSGPAKGYSCNRSSCCQLMCLSDQGVPPVKELDVISTLSVRGVLSVGWEVEHGFYS